MKTIQEFFIFRNELDHVLHHHMLFISIIQFKTIV